MGKAGWWFMCVLHNCNGNCKPHVILLSFYPRGMEGNPKMATLAKNIQSWEEEWKWVKQMTRGNSSRGAILKASFSVVVYAIWIEKNERIFQRVEKTIETLVYQVKLNPCLRIRTSNRLVKYIVVLWAICSSFVVFFFVRLWLSCIGFYLRRVEEWSLPLAL